jgi:hypothetical protein
MMALALFVTIAVPTNQFRTTRSPNLATSPLLLRTFPFPLLFALVHPLAQSIPRMLAHIRQTQFQAQRGSHWCRCLCVR